MIYTAIEVFRGGRSYRPANLFLLLASYTLYWYYNKVLTLVLVGITLATWLAALAVQRRRRTAVTVTTVVLAALPLLAFKYYNFLNLNLTGLFSLGGMNLNLPGLNLAIPIGISFFSLQAIGYFIDVVKGKHPAERNLLDYMLFVAFFPQIVSGPISKVGDLMPQIKGQRNFNPERATQGLKLLLWGMFMKVVVADNIGDVITNPLMKSTTYTSPTVIAAVLLYSMQIYCDFAGYSYMAVGIGKLLGFELINNFERPYLSKSVTEFWHRWHRSLSIWLKDYIYIPLGGSRCSRWRSYLNILITFLVSGLWHGASWTFILWGGMHGAVQIGEKRFGLNKLKPRPLLGVIMCVATFIVVTCAWVFFAHPDINSSLKTFYAMFSSAGKHTVDLTLPLILAGVVILKDLADEFEWTHLQVLDSKYTLLRWTSYSVIMGCIMILAVYGEQFIYSGF
ncbi:MAG: MBOAT family protein [Ruminococcus sp.]|nr:MBOAT family protein [Ruminococcus sp.]